MIIDKKIGTSKETIGNANIEQFTKGLESFFRIKRNQLELERREKQSSLKSRRLSQSDFDIESNRINNDIENRRILFGNLETELYNLQISIPDKYLKANVNNLESLIEILNSNTKNEFKRLEKTSKKDKKNYLNDKISKFKAKAKDVLKLTKDKFFKRASAFADSKEERVYFDNGSIKMSDLASKYIDQGKKSINFHSNSDIKLDKIVFEPKESLSTIKSRLENKKVIMAKNSNSGNSIQKIENKYNELVYNSSILNLLEKAKKYVEISPNVYENTSNLLDEYLKKYTKIVDEMYFDIQKDCSYLDSIIGSDQKIEESKTNQGPTLGEKASNIVNKAVDKIEKKQEKKEQNTLEKNLNKLIDEKIQELESSLEYSIPNLKKFKDLPIEVQANYRTLVESHLAERMGKSDKAKALIDAKFQFSVEERIYNKKRDFKISIDSINDICTLDNNQKQIIESFERKLTYIEFEQDFKKYERELQDALRKNREILNSTSPLLNSLNNNLKKNNEGGFTR